MPLSLVLGKPNAGKTGVLYSVAAERASISVPTVLLPSEPDVARARAELTHTRGLVTVRVEQIDRYLSGLWEIHGDGRALVTPIQRRALLRAAVERGPLPNLTTSAITSGFTSVLERLASVMQDPPAAAGESIAGGIAATLRLYHGLLVRHTLVEMAEATRILAERAGGIEFDGPLLANRFDDLTAAQERFLIAAAVSGAEVWLALTHSPGSPATAATDGLLGRLEPLATHIQVAVDEDPGSPEIDSLANTLFVDGGVVSASGDVALSFAYGEEAEAERVAAEVLAATSAEIDHGHIAVIFRDAKRHYSALRRAFAEAGIPADFDVRLGFGETGFGRAMLSLLDFGASGDRTSLVTFLGGRFSGVDSQVASRLDAQWRSLGPGEPPEAFLSALDRVGGGTRRFVRKAIDLTRSGVGVGNAGDWKELAGTILALGYGRDGSSLPAAALADAAAHRRFCAAVDDLAALAVLDCESIGLREVLAGSLVPLPVSERPGHVQVMDVERVRGRRFDCVIIGGLVAGEFPRATAESLFSGDGLKGELGDLGVDLPADKGAAEERLLFYLAITRARSRLVFSRQVADSDGRPLRSSSLLEQVLDLYGPRGSQERTAVQSRTLAFADLGMHSSAPDLPRRALRSVVMSSSGDDIEVVRRARTRFRTQEDRITDPRLLADLAGRGTFGVTELEAYVNCPYSWFYARYVKPDSLEGDTEAQRRGTLAHNILAAFYEGLARESGVERVTPECMDACLSRAESVAAEILSQQVAGIGYRDRLLCQGVTEMVLGLVRRDAVFLPGYTPVRLELGFGAGSGTIDPVGFGDFALRGRIDRIDVSGDRFVVIDYKTGKAVPVAEFEKRGVLQAPLYAEVVRRTLGGRIAGTFYRSLSARERTGLCRGAYDAELLAGSELCENDSVIPMNDVVDSAVHRATEAVEGIRSGRVQRRPLGDHSCAYCTARTWCPEVIS